MSKDSSVTMILSILLLISCLAAGFFAWKTQNLVKEVTKLRPVPTQVAVATSTPDPTADWKTYTNSNFIFKYPNTWKIVEEKNLIKVFPIGYINGSFFTIEEIKIDAKVFYENESTKIGCKLELSNTMLGIEKNIDTISSFSECIDKNYGYFYLNGINRNILIRHDYNDAIHTSSVGAILTTFKFIEPEASPSSTTSP